MERCREAHPLHLMCRCLRVSPSGYYDWRERLPSTRVQENRRLAKQITALHAQSDAVMGSPQQLPHTQSEA